ncbi:MAG TPA: hypothetical protein VGO40_06035 [Longimicrobium sp.]|jgi:hypothetical protein|nr:hypothetical protein [Longimicrobium sp.]
MRTAQLIRPLGVVVLPLIVAASVPVATGPRGLQLAVAACQDGTCCPEEGSTCVVGTNQLPNRYYISSGSCTRDPKQPAPPP